MGLSLLEARVYRTLDELETVRPAWNDLLACYPLSTTFSSPEWLTSWWRHFGNQQELLAVGFFDDTSALAGLALLSLARVRVAEKISLRLLRLMGDGSQDSDNLDLIVRPGLEEVFARSLLRFLETKQDWDFIELNTLPPESPGAIALRKQFERKKWIVIVRKRPASAVPLPLTWDQYSAQLSSEDRKNLDRYARRLEKRYSVQIRRCDSASDLPRFLEALFQHHQARWEAAGKRGSFGSAARRGFYHELATLLLPQERLDFWVMELDGRVVAAQFGFRYDDKVFQLQEGNEPKHAPDRVGFLLRGQVMRELIAQGVRTYDFLGGEPGYKSRWGAQARNYIDIQIAKPFTLGAAYIVGKKQAQAGKEWLRSHIHGSAWEKLHRINLKLRGRG